jgi:exopolyphosphatase / guanosine-5'-triphosphate,3'-diphosphate pyrophosphatase
MFSAYAATALGDLSWSPKKKQLEPHLAPDSAPLWGEVVQARFASLAESLGARKVAMRIV